MKKSASKKKKTASSAGRAVKSKNSRVATPKYKQNICDAVHRVIRLAKKETAEIKSLKAWYAKNC
jgi:hypothetical protein